MKILVSFRGANRIRYWETGEFLAKAFESLGHEVYRYGFVYETNVWFCDPNELLSQSYDLCVICEHNDPSKQPFELRDINAQYKVFCAYDTSYYPDYLKRIVDIIDPCHVFSANIHFMETFWQRPTTFLPYAADKELHFRPLTWPRQYDVVLVGSDRPARRELIAVLQTEGIDAHLISDVYKEDYVDALASAKIVVNENPPEGKGLLNMRFWESQAAGSLLITQQGDGENLFDTYHLDYSNIDDIIRNCNLYLQDYDLRLSRAKLMQDEMIKNHTYDNRAQTILESIYG